ncbi:unnamed protein product [Medioppia subpectinata]|uniref:NADP-dependent oxidoreductase domain-containing protein n=1 Tax=Medioppia subpectinata TaxID=1979941 RepID=A0A7R9L2A6_9ACAR|nr:unnamed protein product [Medioppia subpectinata]CAG2113972.1 unnamed protein product [Medioppia subpectinata]
MPFLIQNAVQIPSVNLVDGHKIPTIGLGTYDLTNQQEVMDRILNDAYDLGYRHIDTAYVYQNEELIGRSLAKMFAANKTRREDLFITSKVWNVFHKRSQVVEAMKLSLNMLGVDYLDLSLVHWPLAFRSGTGFLRPLDEKEREREREREREHLPDLQQTPMLLTNPNLYASSIPLHVSTTLMSKSAEDPFACFG